MKGISLTVTIRIGRLWDEMNLYRIDYQYEIMNHPDYQSGKIDIEFISKWQR